jgi:hypothetical protein
MAAINFALSTALAVTGVIDYTTREGRNIVTCATTKLDEELDEELYDCKPEGLYQFLQAIKGCMHKYRWVNKIGGIIHVTKDAVDMA